MRLYLLALLFSISCSTIVDFENTEDSDGGVDVSTAVCGNGIVEGEETCDGTALGTETCGSQGFSSGLLKCLDTCDGFETRYCYCESCGEDYCLDTQNDNNNCGSCGTVCSSGTECLEGTCLNILTCEDGKYAKYTWMEGEDCWGNPTNEATFFCIWTCCGGTAVIDVVSGESWSVKEGNPDHCGGCGIECSEYETCKQHDYTNPTIQFRCE